LHVSGPARRTENPAPAGGAQRAGGWRRIAAVAGTLTLLIAALVVLPGWIPLLPRAVVRRTTESFLRGVLLVYSALLLAGLIGVPVTAWLLVRSPRRGRRPSAVVRVFLLCFSCLFSLAALEIGSAAWRNWMHRLPVMPTSFPDPDAGEYRIVVLGGSSAMGEPFRPWLSVGQIVAWRLQRAVPTRRFELDILAFLGDSLEQQHKKLIAITKRPDAVIIYSGHNEFTARFEENRDYSLAEEPRLRLLQSAYRVRLHSPFCRLVYELVSKNRLDSPPLMNGRHQLIDPPLCSPLETAEVLADFTARLEALVGYCERIGALPILIVPPTNEADYEPSRSTLPPTVSGTERDRLVREFFEARRGSDESRTWPVALPRNPRPPSRLRRGSFPARPPASERWPDRRGAPAFQRGARERRAAEPLQAGVQGCLPAGRDATSALHRDRRQEGADGC